MIIKKLDNSVLCFEIQLKKYNLIRSDRNGHGGGVACFIKNDLSCNMIYLLLNTYWIFTKYLLNIIQLLNIFERLAQTIQKYRF